MRRSGGRWAVLLMAGVIAAGLAPAVLAQSQQLAMTAEITDARKANGTLMREYTWHSRTELIMAGQVKDTRIDLVSYGPSGQVQRSLLNDISAPLPFGFLRRIHAKNEEEEAEKYVKALRSLLDQYTLPTEGKVLDFLNGAKVTGPD